MSKTYNDRIARLHAYVTQEAAAAGKDPMTFTLVLLDVTMTELDTAEHRISAGFTRAKPEHQH